jgi:hypothetical protein
MHLKFFAAFPRRVPDPMRPGRTATVHELRDAKGTGYHYTDKAGNPVKLTPDAQGWVEFPHEVGLEVQRFRGVGGAGWYTPAEVDEEVELGTILEDVTAPVDTSADDTPRRAPRARKAATA